MAFQSSWWAKSTLSYAHHFLQVEKEGLFWYIIWFILQCFSTQYCLPKETKKRGHRDQPAVLRSILWHQFVGWHDLFIIWNAKKDHGLLGSRTYTFTEGWCCPVSLPADNFKGTNNQEPWITVVLNCFTRLIRFLLSAFKVSIGNFWNTSTWHFWKDNTNLMLVLLWYTLKKCTFSIKQVL